MNLLPKYHSDFSSVNYWETFFKKRVNSFEWYGNYFELCGILNRYFKPKDDVLVVGCGNSNLSEQMYDTGCQKITNIDISKTVIKQMQDRNKGRDQMHWLEMDITKMQFEDESFSVVIDKGTLDAMMSGDEMSKQIDEMFEEIGRVLKNAGRYICISLAQDHIMKKMLDYFPSRNWLVRIHKVWTDSSTDDVSNKMPVFAFIFTKFQKMPMKILEVCLEDSVKPTRLKSEDEVADFIKAQQYYAMIRNTLASNDAKDDMPPVELFTSEQVNLPRYRIYVIDLTTFKHSLKFGIFIIPHGRETEWLFATHEGRQQVAESAKFKRLAIVALSRDHVYADGMNGIQTELSSRVMELAPAKLPKEYKVPFLSIGGDNIGERHVRHRCKSKFCGSFIVEDYIGDENKWFRQLIFENQGTCVQSVVELMKKPYTKQSGKKSPKQKSTSDENAMVPNPIHLASIYQRIIVASLASTISTLNDKFKVLVIGLGGGTLCCHLLHVFRNCQITAIELDPGVAEVASKWFGLGSDRYKSRVNIQVEDGLVFLKKLVNSNTSENPELFDVLILDANCNDKTKSLQCPAEPFVELKMIRNMAAVLKEKGCLLLNMLSRDQNTKNNVTERICEVFTDIYHKKCSPDLNEVLICLKSPCKNGQSDKNGENTVDQWTSTVRQWEKGFRKSHKETLELSDNLENVVKIF
uniref:eEF1A lysine and N-terminal methyltransferase n=1 Tax=Phallusia mammillata TaxID=59560 RepID=A0A6F9DLH3_9ASCI|nr:methyltransferase-like protein 13 [Phallusia mammillata]